MPLDRPHVTEVQCLEEQPGREEDLHRLLGLLRPVKHVARKRADQLFRDALHAPLYLEDKIGTIAVGMEADLTVLDLNATPILEYRMKYAKDLDEVLFVVMTLGDDRTACATYVAGELLYSRDANIRNETFCASLSGV